jgi:hypothetical protein
MFLSLLLQHCLIGEDDSGSWRQRSALSVVAIHNILATDVYWRRDCELFSIYSVTFYRE